MDKYGVQELNSKGLIDTVEEIKNGGLGSMYKDLSPQYNDAMSIPQKKTQE